MNEKKIRVAIADDHCVLAECLADMLVLMGFDISLKAHDGSELIKAIEHANEIPDVCILDINMPVMNGLETLIELQKRWPDIRVLVLSLGDKEQIILRMLLEGARGYLIKNCSSETLKKAIESVYHNGVYYSEQVSKQLWNFIKQGKIKLPALTPMEWSVVELSCIHTDMSWHEIAKRIGVSTDSVHGFRDSIFRKLEVHSRAGLVKLALQDGFIPFENYIDNGAMFYKKI